VLPTPTRTTPGRFSGGLGQISLFRSADLDSTR
jgi:hypothetical protein